KKPPIVNNNQLNHIMSPCCFAPIKNDIDAENTTVKVNRNFTSLLKSEIKALINNSSPNQHRCRLAVQCRMFHILTALHVSCVTQNKTELKKPNPPLPTLSPVQTLEHQIVPARHPTASEPTVSTT